MGKNGMSVGLMVLARSAHSTGTGFQSLGSLGTRKVFVLGKTRTQYDLTAFIYDKRGRVLAVGKNSYAKTHPLQIRHAQANGRPDAMFLHAEIHAITRCKDLTKAHRIFVIRTDKKGNPKLAKPCGICMSAIEEAGIDIVEYTT